MPDLIARILYALAAAIARLPWTVLYRIGDAIAALWRWRDARESRVARRNLALAFPAMAPAQREALHRAVLRTTARQALETLRLWTRTRADNFALIRECEGVAAFDAAASADSGEPAPNTFVMSPLGPVEVFSRTRFAVATPPKSQPARV